MTEYLDSEESDGSVEEYSQAEDSPVVLKVEVLALKTTYKCSTLLQEATHHSLSTSEAQSHSAAGALSERYSLAALCSFESLQ